MWAVISRLERKSALAAVVCALAAGLTVLLELTIATYPGPPTPGWWWTAYSFYLLVLLAAEGFLPRIRPINDNALVSALVVLGVAVFLLYPDQGWTAIILAVTAAVAASVWRPSVVAGVIVVQTAAVVAGVLSGGWPMSDVVISVIAYGAFQWFGALVVRTARREAEARRELAIAHAELRAASTLMEVSSRDAERLRISRDLHDVVGHKLTALALELEVASHLVPDAARDHVARGRAVAKDVLTDLRTTVGRMRDTRYPLEQMLHSLAADVPGLEVTLDAWGAARVEGEEAVAVLRFAQEVITNTLRHAQATRLHIAVRSDESGICVEARDNGCGAVAIVPGYGLRGMEERFVALGGSLDVRSEPGAGFTILGHLPSSVAVRAT